MKKVEAKVEIQITKEELTKIQDQQKELNTLLRDIGYVETQKHLLLHKQAELNNSIEEYKLEFKSPKLDHENPLPISDRHPFGDGKTLKELIKELESKSADEKSADEDLIDEEE